MRRTGLPVILAVLLAASAGAYAADVSGHFANHDTQTMVTELPDGGKAVIFHYYELWIADTAEDPLGDAAGDCVGRMILDKEGAPTTGSGICFTRTTGGDGSTLWWKVDEAGTTRCKDICGSWGYIEGFGKYKGVTGSGTWIRTTLFSDGSLGSYKGTVTRK